MFVFQVVSQVALQSLPRPFYKPPSGGFMVSLFLLVVFTIYVRKVRASVYKVIGWLGVVGFLLSLFIFNNLFVSNVPELLKVMFVLERVFMLAITCLSFYLGKKMFPNYGFFTPKKDESGKWLL
jgi:polyferredoxin